MNDFVASINDAANGSYVDFVAQYHQLVQIKSVRKDFLHLYYHLRALLAIRSGQLSDAEKCVHLFYKLKPSGKKHRDFLLALIANGAGRIDESVSLLKECLFAEPVSLRQLYFLSSIYTLSESPDSMQPGINHELTAFRPKDIRLQIDLFTSNLLKGGLISDSLIPFCCSSPFAPLAFDLTSFVYLEWEHENMANLKKMFRGYCQSALNRFDRLFHLDLEFGYFDDRLNSIDSVGYILDERRRRVSIRLRDQLHKVLPTKALQMMAKPDCWMQAQDHMFPFLCAEISRIMSICDCSVLNVHEIGPGCGYLIGLLSGIKNIVVTASDCFDSRSVEGHGDDFPLEDFVSKTASSQLSYEKLDLFCYYLVNNEAGHDLSVENHPVSFDSFSNALLDSELVYAHLPALDIYDSEGCRSEAWDHEKWMMFFNNIFSHPKSKVQSVVIAKNKHSKGLDDFDRYMKSFSGLSWRLIALRGPFCCGLVVVARRILRRPLGSRI